MAARAAARKAKEDQRHGAISADATVLHDGKRPRRIASAAEPVGSVAEAILVQGARQQRLQAERQKRCEQRIDIAGCEHAEQQGCGERNQRAGNGEGAGDLPEIAVMAMEDGIRHAYAAEEADRAGNIGGVGGDGLQPCDGGRSL